MYQDASELVTQRSFELELFLILGVGAVTLFAGFFLIEPVRKKLRRRARRKALRRQTPS